MIDFLLEPLTWFVTRRYLYHLDKIAHTAVLTLLLAALGHVEVRALHAFGFTAPRTLSLTAWAILAACLYFGLGKLLWYTSASYHRHATGPIRPEVDWFSDAALSWCVVILAAAYEGRWLGWFLTVGPPLVYLYAVAKRKTSP